MNSRSFTGGATTSPPLEKGRSVREARRVGVTRFNRTPNKTSFARRLRRNSTDVEMLLWQELRRGQVNGFDFRRQHPAGPYILDFYCSELRLAIELDGGQHNGDSNIARDQRRTAWLAERNVTALRFWNADVMRNLPGVLEVIMNTVTQLKDREATPTRRWRADLPLTGGGRPSSLHR
jgi:very-short-patch-repair endonuclease